MPRFQNNSLDGFLKLMLYYFKSTVLTSYESYDYAVKTLDYSYGY